MSLIERVAMLLRANVNDLVDRAEDPVKMLKQLVRDMENQLLQLKTRVAGAMADEEMLQRKYQDYAAHVTVWSETAEAAVKQGEDELARQALDRKMTASELSRAFQQQCEEAREETEGMRRDYLRLEAKLRETRGQFELLSARHKRARTTGTMPAAGAHVMADRQFELMEKMREMIDRADSTRSAMRRLDDAPILEERLVALKREQEVELLLAELKERKMLEGRV